MASNENKTVTYKFGLDDLDLKKYIHNIGRNVQGYLNSRDWNDREKLEFIKSYNVFLQGFNDQLANNTNRFSADDFGNITDSLGIISKDTDPNIGYYYDKNGKIVSIQDYDKLDEKDKKNYRIFRPNVEVANYFNLVGNALRDSYKQSNDLLANKSNKFDLNKHGFVTYWLSKNNPSGDVNFDMTPYINRDSFNELTGKREVVNRATDLADLLLEYINKGNFQDYDFSDSSYKTKENYISSLNNVINNLRNNKWDDNDLISLNQAGIGGDFVKYLLTTEENPNITPELKKAIEEKEKQDEINKKKREFIDSQYSIYLNSNPLYNSDNKFRILGRNNWLTNEGKFDYKKFALSIDKRYVLDNGKLDESAIDREIINPYILNPFTNKEKDPAKILEVLIDSNYARPISNNPQLQGMYYIPSAADLRLNRVLVYDPINGDLFYTFVGDIPELWSKMTYNYNITNGLFNPTDKYFFKDGGILEYQLGGGFSIGKYMTDKNQELLEQQALENGRSIEKLYDLERKPLEEKNALETNNGFTSAETARLIAAGADITSMVSSFIPGAGTAVAAVSGVGSSFASLWADVALDGLDWGDIKNLGVNLGMDALGLIPGGGAATKAAKIAKNLKTFIPKLMTIIGTSSAISNAGPIKDSLNKAITDYKSLTVEDWQNIAQAIGVITGVTGGIARHYNRDINQLRGKSLATPKKEKESIALKFRKPDGTTESRIFTGDDAKAIREARDKKDIEAIKEATINKYDDLKDLELDVPKSFRPHLRIPYKEGEWRSPLYRPDKKVNMANVYTDPNTGRKYADYGKFKADVDEALLKTPGKTIKEVEDEIINNALSPLKAASDRDAALINNVVPNYKLRLDRFKRNFRSSDDVQADIDSQNTKLTEKKVRTLLIKTDKLVLNVKKQQLADILNEINNIDTLLVTANFGLRMLLNKLKKDYLSLKNQLTLEINSIANRINSNQGLNRGVNKKRLIELQNELKTSNRVDKIKERLQNDIDTYSSPNYRTKERIAFELAHTPNLDGKITLTDPSTGRTVEVLLADVYNKMGIKYKKGGSLNLSNVRKMLGGSLITNTSSKADWFSDMFSSEAMLKWLSSYNTDNYEDFNKLLRSWNTNRQTTGYKPGTSSVTWNLGVYDRQKLWNDTGTNSVIEDLSKNGIITRVGNSGDNLNGGYADGYFGELEYLRHGGTGDSWKGHEADLSRFQEELKKRGLQYTLDSETGMYLLSPITPDNTQNTSISTNVSSTAPNISTPIPTITPVSSELNELEDTEKGSVPNLGNFLIPPTIMYGLPRALFADMMNRRITRLAKNSTKPLLKDPFEVHRTVKSDLDAEMLGLRTYANLRSLATKPLTSLGELLTATLLETLLKGLDAIRLGNEQSNKELRTSFESAWLQEKENAANRHETAMINKMSQFATLLDNSKYDLANLSRRHNIYDTLALQIEFDNKQNIEESKAIKDSISRSNIRTAVMYDPNKYGANLSNLELEVWKLSLNGIDPSKLSNIQLSALLSAKYKVSIAELSLLLAYLNNPNLKWEVDMDKLKLPTNNYTISINKNGGSLEIAGIKAKTADAERFQKLIKESIDRNEKAIARLSKSMYKILNILK